MKKKFYKIMITETLSRVIVQEAENEEQAKDLVEYQYRNGDIILYPDNFEDVNFISCGEVNSKEL